MYPVIIFIQSENSELSTFIFLIEKLGKTFSSFSNRIGHLSFLVQYVKMLNTEKEFATLNNSEFKKNL